MAEEPRPAEAEAEDQAKQRTEDVSSPSPAKESKSAARLDAEAPQEGTAPAKPKTKKKKKKADGDLEKGEGTAKKPSAKAKLKDKSKGEEKGKKTVASKVAEKEKSVAGTGKPGAQGSSAKWISSTKKDAKSKDQQKDEVLSKLQKEATATSTATPAGGGLAAARSARPQSSPGWRKAQGQALHRVEASPPLPATATARPATAMTPTAPTPNKATLQRPASAPLIRRGPATTLPTTWMELEEAKTRAALCMSMCELLQGSRLGAGTARLQGEDALRQTLWTYSAEADKIKGSISQSRPESGRLVRERGQALSAVRCSSRCYDRLTRFVIDKELRFCGAQCSAAAADSALKAAPAALAFLEAEEKAALEGLAQMADTFASSAESDWTALPPYKLQAATTCVMAQVAYISPRLTKDRHGFFSARGADFKVAKEFTLPGGIAVNGDASDEDVDDYDYDDTI